MMVSPVLTVGRTLGHYRIIEEIGAGGMGVVYRAHDERLQRDVALKVLAPEVLIDESSRKRFRNEALALSRAIHPNIATVHDFDVQDGLDFLVMEYIQGVTVSEKLRSAPFPEKEIIGLGIQLAEGLSAAHEHGIVHRDLKPGNLRLSTQGILKILDFGIASVPVGDSVTTQSSTDIGVIAGTLMYMAPEQLLGRKVDARTDIYAMGLVLYQMATGQHPFMDVERSRRLIGAILNQVPLPARQRNPIMSPELERIIARCLNKEPLTRYQTAKEVAADLCRLEFASSTTESTAAKRPLPRWAKSRAVIALGITTVLVSITLFLRGRPVGALTQSDTIVVADFVNSTSDPVFDDTLNQALTVELEQSPFLKIIPRIKVRDTLQLMGRSPEEPLTPELSRDVCQRAGGKAVLWGSIAPLGSQYVIGLTAAECNTGSHLASEQTQTANKESVLKALGKAASHLRSKLGESLSSVQKFDTPLDQATTPSLEALKAYSRGRQTQFKQGSTAAIPSFKRAIELDPNFAVAYDALGLSYSNLGEPGLANENLQRAYELRNHVSERERLRISASYHSYFDGDLVKGSEIYALWAQTYPRDAVPLGNLGAIDLYLGNYEKARRETLEHLRLEPDSAIGYSNLIVAYTDLNRLTEAKAAYQEAIGRKLEDYGLHGNLYEIAFLEADVNEMERQLAWAADKSGAADVLLSFSSDTEAFYGRLSKARALSLRAVSSARGNDQKETAAGWQMNAALREAEFGNTSLAREATSSALALASTRDVQIFAALALARAGVLADAQRLAEDLAKRFPRDTLVTGYWLPTIGAAIEIQRRNPSKAVEILQAAVPYELGEPYPSFQGGGSLYPIYLRAQSYLLLHRGEEARAEFQKILEHRSIVKNCPLGALAQLGLGRAYAVLGDPEKARAAYRDFLRLWDKADPDIPILKEAKLEYARLR